MPKPRVAVVVGHRESSQGADSSPSFKNGGVSEWTYNSRLARAVAGGICGMHVEVIFRDDTHEGYNRLPAKINKYDPDFILSLHFNSFGDSSANGTETLHWDGSTEGEAFAESVQKHMLQQLGLTDRGLKAQYGRFVNGEWVGDRGSWLLGRTAAPCVIAEPGFGSNRGDWQVLCDEKHLLTLAYVRAIKEYVSSL